MNDYARMEKKLVLLDIRIQYDNDMDSEKLSNNNGM